MTPEGAVDRPPSAPEKASKECISVVARVRPSQQPSPSVHLKKGELEVAIPRGDDTVNNQIEEYHFKFSRVFGPETTQTNIFDGVAKDLVLGALDGVNCTIFAYGQTGSGKTHTICGNHRDRGIIPRSLACIFDAIDHRHDNADYSVSMSFIEVYKEIGYDLLSKDFGSNQDSWQVVSVSLQSGDPVLQGAKRVAIATEDEGLHQYFLGDTHRTVAETPHNLNSSRSHCIFTIFVEASDPASQTVRTSKVQIVDLAGSERLKPYEAGSQNDKVLMGQAVAINLSLHWLEGVINALNRSSGVVPYRNSFLTKVLKDALGGNARAVMVATINPSDAAMPETISTCRFAQRVANVQTNARVNEERDPQLVIAALRQENAELRAALGAVSAGEGGNQEAIPDDELRKRARSFLEDESGDGSTGGAALVVGSLVQAFAAFRVLRELFWEMLRRRGSASRSSEARPSSASPVPGATPLTEAPANAGSEGPEEAAGSPGPGESPARRPSTDEKLGAGGESLETLKKVLEERDGECRMLRAALAAQPPRPAARPVRPQPVRARSVSAATQTDASLRKVPKTKRPTSAGADNRPKGMRGFIGFSPEDVVDPFGRLESKGTTLPPLVPKVTDARVPDFRRLQKEEEEEEEEDEEDDAGDEQSERGREEGGRPPDGAQTARAAGSCGADAQASSPGAPPARGPGAPAATQPSPGVQPDASAAEAPAPKAPAPQPGGGASAAWLHATTALTEAELAMTGSKAKAYQVFLQHDPRAADIWPSDLKALRQDRRDRMEEARALGEEIERTKDATRKVQEALASLKDKLRQAEVEAAVDAAAAQRAGTLKNLLAVEEPRLVQLFDEKRQRYELDFSRLKELRREISHLEHAEKKLETTVQSEYEHWTKAVAERYPEAVKAAEEAEANGTAPALPVAAQRPASAGPPGDVVEAADPHASAVVPTVSPVARTAGGGDAAAAAAAAPPEAAADAPGAGPAAGAVDAAGASAPPPVAAASCGASAGSAPNEAKPGAPPGNALAMAEAALANLRQRLDEARANGDERRQQMLEQLLAAEEPRLAKLREQQGLQ